MQAENDELRDRVGLAENEAANARDAAKLLRLELNDSWRAIGRAPGDDESGHCETLAQAITELRAENEQLRKAAAMGLDCLLDYGGVNTPMVKAIKALKKALGDWRAARAALSDSGGG